MTQFRNLLIAVGLVSVTVACAWAQNVGLIGTNTPIQSAPFPPSLICPATTGSFGSAYSSSLQGSGGTSPYVSFALSAGSGPLPTGLTLNTSTGAITGTPVLAAAFTFTATVTDTAGRTSAPSSCTITISNSNPPTAPTNPNPASGATNVGTTPTLTWTPGTGANTEIVRFGTTNPPPSIPGPVSGSYTPGALSNSTTYYWSVCDSNTFGSTCSATIWTFTTIAGGVVPSGSSCADPADDSPTGRNPLFLSCSTMHTMKAAWTAYNLNTANPPTAAGKYVKILVQVAAGLDTYANCTLYQMNGISTYKDACWAAIANNFLTLHPTYGDGTNRVRENLIRQMMFRDIMEAPGAMTAQQKTDWFTEWDEMVNWTFTGPILENAFRTEDTDQTVGYYYGLAMQYLLFGSTHANAITRWNQTYVGGFCTAATNTTIAAGTTLCNVVQLLYSYLSHGGEWPESRDYNMGTMQFTALGHKGFTAGYGSDTFADAVAFYKNWIKAQIYLTLPNFAGQFTWGDEEAYHTFRVGINAVESTAVAAGVVEGTTEAGYAHDFIQDMAERFGYGTEVNSTAQLNRDAFLAGYDPDGTRGDTTTLPKDFYADGQGITVHRDGWGSTDAAYFAYCLNQTISTDHQIEAFCYPQMWRKGEMVFGHGLSYAGASLFGWGVNTMMFVDIFSSFPNEYRKVTGQATGSSPDYNFLSGTTGGQPGGGFWAPYLDTFAEEWTRDMLHIPCATKTCSVIILHDRVNMKDPRTLSQYGNWQYLTNPFFGNYKTVMDAASYVSKWFFHMPVSPTIVGTKISWTTAGGQLAEIHNLLPATVTRTSVDEHTLTHGLWTTMLPTELEWQVNIKQTTESQHEYGLNVMIAKDSGVTSSATLIAPSTEHVAGVVVSTTGNHDAVAFFNETDSSDLIAGVNPANTTTLDYDRYLAAGFDKSWTTSGAGTADVWVNDLKPTITWHYQIDSGSVNVCTLESGSGSPGAGICRIAGVSGAGAHTVHMTTP